MSQAICGCRNCMNQPCTGRVPMFAGLDTQELNQVKDLIIHRLYEKGELLIMEGEQLESLYIISGGQVKAFRDSTDGREQILYIFSTGDFFGEKNLFIHQNATYNVEALERTYVCLIRRLEFQEMIKTYPTISLKVMETLCNRLDKLEKTVEHMGTGSVEKRINAVLLEFAEKYGKPVPNGILIELPLSREGIANYIGLTRETVSRKLSVLQDDGMIDMIGNKKILIKDRKALEEVV